MSRRLALLVARLLKRASRTSSDDGDGQRASRANSNPSSKSALEVIAERAHRGSEALFYDWSHPPLMSAQTFSISCAHKTPAILCEPRASQNLLRRVRRLAHFQLLLVSNALRCGQCFGCDLNEIGA